MAVEVEAGAYINQAGVLSHNPLHDLESLWWVGVWFLLCHYQPRKMLDVDVQQHIEVIKKYGQNLFNNRVNTLSRRHALTGPDLLANIEPLSFSVAVQHLTLFLDFFRDQLVENYKLYKPKMTSEDWSFFNPDLHRKFARLVENVMKELGNDESELWLVGHIEKNIAFYNFQK